MNKTKEEQLEYLTNRFGEILYQYNYDFSLYQRLKFSKFRNKKVFRIVNIILLSLTVLIGFPIGLLYFKIGYNTDIIVLISMVLFIRFFGLLLKIAILISDKEKFKFKAEIREKGIIIGYYTYDIKEISNIEMEKYYDGSMPSIKFAISDKNGLKHYHYWPYDDTIEKFCNDSILYYKKKHINIKIPIDNREPTSYETKNSISDYWLLLSEDKRLEVKKYFWKGIFSGLGIALFMAIILSLTGDDGSGMKRGISAFLFSLIIFSLFHILTFLDGFKSPSVEIKENRIIIGKPDLSHDYIECSSITDAGYIHFKKEGVEGIKLLIIADGKEYIYTWLKNPEIEKFCNDVVDISKNNKEYYSKINSSD